MWYWTKTIFLLADGVVSEYGYGPQPYPPFPPYAFMDKGTLSIALLQYCANVPTAVAEYGRISDWDVSAVTDYGFLFSNLRCNLNISAWDVSNIDNMDSAFQQATNFNHDLSAWDTSRVRNMAYMFQWAMVFNQDLSSWNTEKVENMAYMFQGAMVFNQDLSSWNTENVKNMAFMFYQASAFNSDISGWSVDKVTSFQFMFYDTNLSDCNKFRISKSWSSNPFFPGEYRSWALLTCPTTAPAATTTTPAATTTTPAATTTTPAATTTTPAAITPIPTGSSTTTTPAATTTTPAAITPTPTGSSTTTTPTGSIVAPTPAPNTTKSTCPSNDCARKFRLGQWEPQALLELCAHCASGKSPAEYVSGCKNECPFIVNITGVRPCSTSVDKLKAYMLQVPCPTTTCMRNFAADSSSFRGVQAAQKCADCLKEAIDNEKSFTECNTECGAVSHVLCLI